MISDLAFDNFRFKVKLKFIAKILLVVTSLATVNFYLGLVCGATFGRVRSVFNLIGNSPLRSFRFR